jgi:hypothetical protein
MTGDVFDDLRRQREEFERLLEPYRRQHEEILRSLAPVRELQESLRRVTEGLYTRGGADDLLRSMAKIGQPELADFKCLAALAAPSRELTEVSEAIKQQSRWITEAFQLTTGFEKRTAAEATSLAAFEKLVASQSALLDPEMWRTPRPFWPAMTDIFHVGRSEWAVTFPTGSRDVDLIVRLTRASEEVTAKLAAISGSSLVFIRPEDAKGQASAVANVLREALSSFRTEGGEGARVGLDAPDEAEAFRNFRMIIEVVGCVEDRAGKRIGAGYCGWLAKYTLDVLDASRSSRDRFCSVVDACHDMFVDGVENANRSIAKKSPRFFRETIKDLRDTLSAHAPEAAKPAQWVADNLRKREWRLLEVCGRVPVTEAEWRAALHLLLEKAAAAAIEFRDALSK